jgi:hypothetical protein
MKRTTTVLTNQDAWILTDRTTGEVVVRIVSRLPGRVRVIVEDETDQDDGELVVIIDQVVVGPSPAGK